MYHIKQYTGGVLQMEAAGKDEFGKLVAEWKQFIDVYTDQSSTELDTVLEAALLWTEAFSQTADLVPIPIGSQLI